MSEDSAKKSLEQVTGWELKNEGDILKLHRAWKVKNFVKGLEFFQLVAAVAEEEGHHPDLHLVSWNNVKIDVWTHSVSKCFIWLFWLIYFDFTFTLGFHGLSSSQISL
ncbi:hypothetical protein ACQJBY_027464 [Aegilops geniculata]